MGARAYLDWNATAWLRPEARAAMMRALDHGGNPSSVHAEGRAARRSIENARHEVAALVGAEPQCVVFTSGGTEANMLALTPAIAADADRGNHHRDRLMVSAIEHPSVRGGGRFSADRIETIPVTPNGVIALESLAQRLDDLARRGSRPLLSIMLANNESGSIQPIALAAKIIHEAGGLLHVDAVQAPGKVGCDIGGLGADLLTLSGHKLGGPKGVGALVRRDASLHIGPLMIGGGQERGWRAGTENVAAIAGFGAAAVAAHANLARETAAMQVLRCRLEAGLKAVSAETVIFCEGTDRLPNTTLFALPGVKAETAVMALDLDGVAVSSGAACSSGKVQPSHVLSAMGVTAELARGAIRVSLGYATTQTELDCFLNAWTKFIGSLHKGVGGLAA